MKELFIFIVLVGCIQADPGWDPGKIYTYNINSQSLSTLRDLGKDYQGVVIKGLLTLQSLPAQNGSLSGQISDLQYAEVHDVSPDECSIPAQEISLNWKEITFSSNEFGVEINDGVVKKLLLERNTTTEEANLIKAIVSQLQIDFQGKNKIATNNFSADYQSDNFTKLFSSMEESIIGHCETIYDISPSPENIIRSKPSLAPLLNGSFEINDVMDVMKIINFNNCHQHVVYHRGMNEKDNWDAGKSNIGDIINRKAEARLIVQGTFQNYTIHSSVITDKIQLVPSLYKTTKVITVSCVNLTLVDIKETNVSQSLSSETSTTLLYDYEYESAENIDIYHGSSLHGQNTNPENQTRSSRSTLNYSGPRHSNKHRRDISTTPNYSTTEFPSTTLINNATYTPTDNFTRSNYESTTMTSLQNISLDTSTMFETNETSTISSIDTTMITNTTIRTPENDSTTKENSSPTTKPNSKDDNRLAEISEVLQLLNVSKSLQKPLLSSFTSIYSSTRNKTNLQPKEIESTIKTISEEIAGHTLDFHTIINENTLSAFCQLTYLISNVEYEILHYISNAMYHPPNGSDNKRRQAWIVFRDAVSQAGTGPALMLIKEWIIFNKTTSNEAEDIIGGLPKNAEVPNEQYIEALFDMVKNPQIKKQESIHASLLLAFSNIIRQVIVDNHSQKALYPIHIFSPMIQNTTKLKSVYLQFLEENLEKAVSREDSCQIHIYTKALGNVAHPEILNVFKQYLVNNTKMTIFQKTFLIMCLEKITELYPEETRNFLFALFIDIKQHYEVRTAIVFQIMRTKPPINILKKMAEITQYDTSNQVIAAVKTSIYSAAQLTNSEDAEFKEDAKSVIHLLNSKNLGIHYSYHSFNSYILSQLGNLGFHHSVSYIGSQNNILPKGLFVNWERFLGRLSPGKENYGIMFSDITKLSHILENLWITNKDSKYRPENQPANESDDKNLDKDIENEQNLSDSFTHNGNNHSRENKIDTEEDKNEPETILFLPLDNSEKFITFGKNFSSSIKNWLQQKVKSLRTGYKFNYTKIFQRDNFFYAVPNVAGFITQFAFRVPTIYHSTGKLKFDIQQSHKSPDAVQSQLQNLVLTGRLSFGYALNKHTDVGFVTPFNGKRYIVGFKEQLLINIPITINMTATSNTQVIKINTKISPLSGNTMGFYFQLNSQLYRQCNKLSDIIKKQRVTQEEKPDVSPQKQIVKNFQGFQLNASLPQFGNYSTTIQRNIYASIYSNLRFFEKLKSLNNMNIIFRADFPDKKSSVTMQTLYANINNFNTEKEESKSEVSRSKQSSSTNLMNGMNNNTIISEWNILLDNNKQPKFRINFNYTWNEFTNSTNFKFGYYEKSNERDFLLLPKITISFDGIWAKVPVFNFSKGISINPTSQFTAALLLGSSKNPITILKCDLQRTDERKSFLMEQIEVKKCEEDIQDGNFILPSCQQALLEANYLDQLNCTMQIENSVENSELYVFAINAIHMVHQNFIFHSRNVSGPSNQIAFLTQFAPNFEYTNVSISFPKIEARFNNVGIHSLLKPMIQIHPFYSVISRTEQTLLGRQFNPICALDKTKLNTFDNQTYSIYLGSCWYVLMALTFQNSANLKLNENDVLILVSDRSEGRVLRMIIGSDIVDITIQELSKETSFKYIYVNNMQFRLPKEKFTRISLNSQINNSHLLGTVEEENIKLHFTNFSVIFDGNRVLLMTKNKFRNQTLGLCGTFTGEENDDFVMPSQCKVNDSKQFIASYAIVNNNTCSEEITEWRNNAINETCSVTSDIYVRSDFPKFASCHNEHNKVSDPRCMSVYTRVLQDHKHTCFSQHALPKCKEFCYPIKLIKKNVRFHCLPTAVVSKQFVARIREGKLQDFSKKKTSKTITVDVPSGCYKC